MMGLWFPGSDNLPSRRVRYVDIAGEIILAFFDNLTRADGRVQCVSPIPDDARVVGVGCDFARNTVRIYVASASFAEIPADGYPSPWEIKMATHYDAPRETLVSTADV